MTRSSSSGWTRNSSPGRRDEDLAENRAEQAHRARTARWTLADLPVVRRWRLLRRAPVAVVGPDRYQTPTFSPFRRTAPPVYQRALHRRTSPLRNRRREASLCQARRPPRVRAQASNRISATKRRRRGGDRDGTGFAGPGNFPCHYQGAVSRRRTLPAERPYRLRRNFSPRSSCAASTDTELDYGERGGGGGGGQRVDPQHDRTTVEDDINTLCHQCSCEGDCVCAIGARSPSADAERNRAGVPLRPIGVLTNNQVAGKAEEEQEKRKYGEGGEDPEQSCCGSRSTIVRLLGARTGRLQSGSGGPTTATSTRRFSVYPRDGHVGKVPRIGSTSSYEKLSNDELEITRKTVLYASDPTSIDSGDQRRRVRGVRRYSSCDLDNLCEGVTVLDGLLARRGVAVAHGRKQSVTVMLFGTPAHGTFHRRATDDDQDDDEAVRVSRLSLDATPN